MGRALMPRARWQAAHGWTDRRLRWRGCSLDAGAHAAFCELSGIDAAPDREVSIVFPQVTVFRLVMALLTDPRWPLPIWRALQVRNRLRQRRPLRVGERFEAEAGMAAWRVLPKGVEVDIATRLLAGDDCVWDSVVTFYYRGHHGAPQQRGVAAGAPAAPVADTGFTTSWARWRVAGGGRWRFAALTGDYNGIHQWDGYARHFGFAGAFAHPHRVAAFCLSTLSKWPPATLDLWFRGPVYYGREVELRRVPRAPWNGDDRFMLAVDGEARPAMLGVVDPRPHAGRG